MSKSRITSLALMVAAMSAVGATYPVTVQFENNTWTHGVEPETCTEALPYQSATMVIRDADQFNRVLSNLDGVNLLSGWIDGAGLFIVLPGADEALAAQSAGTGEQEVKSDAAPGTDEALAAPETPADTAKSATGGKKRT